MASQEQIEADWKVIEEGLETLISLSQEGAQKLPQDVYVHLHKFSYEACIKGSTAVTHQLYRRFGLFVDNFCKEKILPQVRNKYGDSLLTAILQHWTTHKLFIRWDRQYANLYRLTPMKKMALDSFRLMVLEPTVMENVTDSMISIVERDRSALFNNTPVEGIDNSIHTLQEMAQALVEMGSSAEFYENGFESPFLKSSVSFYKNFKGFLKNKSQMEDTPYEKLVVDFVKSEQQRISKYLPSSTSTLQKTMEKCSQEILGQSYETFQTFNSSQ